MKKRIIKIKIASIVLAIALLFPTIISTSHAGCDGVCYHPNIDPATNN